MRGWRFFLGGMAIASFLATRPGGYFRLHYFLLAMPALALFAGTAVAGGTQALAGRKASPAWAFLPGAVALAAIGQALWSGRAVFFEVSPVRACRTIYGDDPFPESVAIGRYLREHTAPGARIAVIGSGPQIYFYARRRSATSFLYTYPLVEDQPYATTMQHAFIREVEAADPDYIVYVYVTTSWCKADDAPRDVFAWWGRYQAARYQIVGMVDMNPDGKRAYRWATDGESLRPAAPAWLAILHSNRLRNEPVRGAPRR